MALVLDENDLFGVDITIDGKVELDDYRRRIRLAKLALFHKTGDYNRLLQHAIEPLMTFYRTIEDQQVKIRVKTVLSTLLSVCEKLQQRQDQTHQEFDQQLKSKTDKSVNCDIM